MNYPIESERNKKRLRLNIKNRKKGILLTDLTPNFHNLSKNDSNSKFCKNPVIFDILKNKQNEKTHSLLIKKKTYLLLNKYLKKNEIINNLFLDFLKELRKIEILVLTEKIGKIEEMKISTILKISKKKKLFFDLKYNILLEEKNKNEFLSFLKLMKKKKINISIFLKNFFFDEKLKFRKKKFNQFHFQQKIFINCYQIEKSSEIEKFVLKKFENNLIKKKQKNKNLKNCLSLQNNILKLNKENKINKKIFSKEINFLFEKKFCKKKLKKQKKIIFQISSKNRNYELFSNFQKKYDEIFKFSKKIKNLEIFKKIEILKNMSDNKKIMEKFKSEEKKKKELRINLKNKKDQEILKKKKIFKANVILFILEISENVTKIYKVLENFYQIKNKNFK